MWVEVDDYLFMSQQPGGGGGLGWGTGKHCSRPSPGSQVYASVLQAGPGNILLSLNEIADARPSFTSSNECIWFIWEVCRMTSSNTGTLPPARPVFPACVPCHHALSSTIKPARKSSMLNMTTHNTAHWRPSEALNAVSPRLQHCCNGYHLESLHSCKGS